MSAPREVFSHLVSTWKRDGARIPPTARAGGDAIEPGLLALFRVFIVIELLLLVLRAALKATLGQGFPVVPSPWPGLAMVALLLAYLLSSRLRARLGRLYLPIAIVAAALLSIFGAGVTTWMRVAAGVPIEDIVRSNWVLIVPLLVPVILVAWQYGFRWVLWFCLFTTIADLSLLLPLATRGGPPAATLIVIALVRCLFFLPVGYAAARLMDAQRQQRLALAEANARLARYAETLEQLATDRERSRLAQELHDTLAHGLSSIAVQLEAMTALWRSSPEKLRAMLADALATTRTALGESRRAIIALRASPLEELGLAKAVRQLAESAARRAGLAVEIRVPDSIDGLSRDAEHAIFRTAAEAVTNVVRHASTRRLTVELVDHERSVRLVVSDDGRGFDAASVGEGHFGLYGMRERARLISAELRVDSAPGAGTSVRLTVGKTNDSRPDL
jgi:signal transduction histidine kinase